MILRRIDVDKLRERWGWFVGLGVVQFLVGAIAFGLLLYGRAILLVGVSLSYEWLVPVLWVMNLLICIHMISNGYSLIMFGLAAENRSADVHSSLPDLSNLEGFERSDMTDCLLRNQSDR